MIPYPTPGLSGLELWQGLAGGVTLFQLRHDKPTYFHGLCDFLRQLHAGRAAAANDTETAALRRARGFRHVVFSGGEALHPALAAILQSEPLPFTIEMDADGPYGARRGAWQIFNTRNWRRGTALDLGQSQLKVITAHGNCSLSRDLTNLPLGAGALPPELGRHRIRAMLQAGLSLAANLLGAPPDGIVLGLPVAIDPDGIAQPATYPGLYGPLGPFLSSLFPQDSVVLNDAVLTALGFPPANAGKSLVVTLGFGIGGALWE